MKLQYWISFSHTVSSSSGILAFVVNINRLQTITIQFNHNIKPIDIIKCLLHFFFLLFFFLLFTSNRIENFQLIIIDSVQFNGKSFKTLFFFGIFIFIFLFCNHWQLNFIIFVCVRWLYLTIYIIDVWVYRQHFHWQSFRNLFITRFNVLMYLCLCLCFVFYYVTLIYNKRRLIPIPSRPFAFKSISWHR